MIHKHQLDELYHLLRVVSVDEEWRGPAQGLASHLLSEEGDYAGLLKWLDRYKRIFLAYKLEDTLRVFLERPSNRARVINVILDVGSGFSTSWVYPVAQSLCLRYMSVDKRASEGRDTHSLGPGDIEKGWMYAREHDLLVMSELIHCLDDPAKTLKPYEHLPWVVIEPIPYGYLGESFRKQLARFGVKHYETYADMEKLFGTRHFDCKEVYPYVIWTVEGRENVEGRG